MSLLSAASCGVAPPALPRLNWHTSRSCLYDRVTRRNLPYDGGKIGSLSMFRPSRKGATNHTLGLQVYSRCILAAIIKSTHKSAGGWLASLADDGTFNRTTCVCVPVRPCVCVSRALDGRLPANEPELGCPGLPMRDHAYRAVTTRH